MIGYIIIIYPVILNPKDFEKINEVLHSVKENISWTIDAEDCDHVLRIEAEVNISNIIQEALLKNGINSKLMTVFNPLNFV